MVALTLGCFVMICLSLDGIFFLLTLVVLKILMACFRKFSEATKVFASRAFSSSSGLIFNLLLTSEK